jgi:hypothetical protein
VGKTTNYIQRKKSHKIHSNYGNKKESEYINKNAQLLDVFVRGEKESPLSAAAIFVNKENI